MKATKKYRQTCGRYSVQCTICAKCVQNGQFRLFSDIFPAENPDALVCLRGNGSCFAAQVLCEIDQRGIPLVNEILWNCKVNYTFQKKLSDTQIDVVAHNVDLTGKTGFSDGLRTPGDA